MKKTKNTTWKQKLSSEQHLKGRINYIFKSAKKNHTSHKDILQEIKIAVYKDDRYTTLPNYMRSNIDGYIQANFNIMYDYIEWSHWYDDKFIGKKLIFNDKFKQSKVKSNYVYIGTQKIY